jgi:flavin reductase (DIM6/NTAB) family NADH-FMN oxidoreductase RutF
MHKTQLGPVNAMYPSLTTIVGTLVDGKPNWITIAHVGILTHAVPQLLSIGVGKMHHSNRGIFENRTFSINIPSREMLIVTDYVGLVSGKKTDKSELFETFYGELKTAPMIAECPVSMELRLNQVVDTKTHDIFIGEVVQTYADERVLENGKIHYGRVDPLLFDFQRIKYWSLGQEIGNPWSAGKAMKRK